MRSLAVSEVRHCMLYSRHDTVINMFIIGISHVARHMPSIAQEMIQAYNVALIPAADSRVAVPVSKRRP